MNLHKLLLFFGLLLLPVIVSAQYNINIEAYVIDQKTNGPVPFANIGFVDSGIGTVSREDGWFNLLYDEARIPKTATIQISSIGYETLSFSANHFYNLLTKDNKIYLRPKVEGLEEAIVYADKSVQDSLGYFSYHSNLMAYWKDKKALGGEIGSFIKVRKKGNTKIRKLKFNILENSADSILVRVNVYNEKRGKPNKNLLRSNIYHTISNKKGEETIDLTPYNIRVKEDFIITLELIKVYGDDIEFAITASQYGKAYLRYVSQDAWKRLYKRGIAFKLETSYFESNKPSEERQKPDHITVYWDTSLSMRNRDLEEEKKLLKKYFSALGNVRVDLIPFSNSLQKKHTFDIRSGKSKQLISVIESLNYNGASDFSKLFSDDLDTDQYLVFTDGLATYGNHEPKYDIPIFYINSKNKGDHIRLQEASQISDGFYLHLPKISLAQSITYLLKNSVDISVYNKDSVEELLSGKIIADQSPVQGCTVRVKGSLLETETDPDGRFLIDAKYNDVLVFEHFGMVKKEITLSDVKDIKVELVPKYDRLDEINLKTKKLNGGQEVVNRGDQKVNKRRLGNGTYVLDKEDFPTSAIFLSDIIRGRFPGVQVIGTGDRVIYRIRGRRSISLEIPPLFIVDGVQFTEAPVFLQPPMIESISVISGLGGTARYGAAGAGGVFIIETTLNSFDSKSEEDLNSLLVKGNDYDESVYLLDASHNRPEYLADLWNSASYKEALASYYDLRDTFFSEISFYIQTAEYFRIWDKEFSEQVLSNIAEIGKDNYKALRSLAFKLEETKQVDKAVILYEKLLTLKPNYAQSYLDLARIYTENKNYTEAFDLYKEMLANKNDNVKFDGIAKQLNSQLQSFMNDHRSQVSYTDIPETYLKVKSIPARIVFDWNDPKAAFELQFVNPENKYFKWSHNYEDQPDVLQKELEQGIVSKEFVLDKTFQGEWIVNIKSLNDNTPSLNPVFMKYTIYHNYGLPEETKEIKFIKLYDQKQKVSLDKFEI
ncbi:carboxypeptidase-like regulatory domain-containing protein [Aquimarina sp. LLG6339-5]|uniref:carboxypeptidase-like regulatory domain-containing protein n=1 Tax=Aquimarina sp. LLG6339-5 TaxID=3160830 RepID=UPI0038647F3A